MIYKWLQVIRRLNENGLSPPVLCMTGTSSLSISKLLCCRAHGTSQRTERTEMHCKPISCAKGKTHTHTGCTQGHTTSCLPTHTGSTTRICKHLSVHTHTHAQNTYVDPQLFHIHMLCVDWHPELTVTSNIRTQILIVEKVNVINDQRGYLFIYLL